MPPSNKILIPKFSGTITSVDDAMVGIQGAVNVENFRIQAGKLLPTEGTTKISNNNVGASTSILGLTYVRGFSDQNVFQEKFFVMSIGTTNTSFKATMFDAAGSSPSFSTTNIGFSTTPTPSLNEWMTVLYDNKIITTNATDIYQMDVGGTTLYKAGGFDPIVGFPNSSPTATYISTSVITAGWAGFTTTVPSIAILSPTLDKISYKTGVATENLLKDTTIPFSDSSTDAGPSAYYLKSDRNIIRFAHPYYGGITAQLSQSKGPFKITLYADDMTSPSRQNFANLQFRDRIYFRFYVADSYSTNWNDNTAKTTFDNSQFKVKFFDRNNKQIQANVNAQSITAVGYDEYVVCAFWDNKDRFSTSVFDYTQVYKVEITGYVSFAWVSTLGNTTPVSKHRNLPSFFDFKPCTIGGVNLSLQPPDRNNQNYINFGTVRYTPSSGEVSEVHNLSTLTSNDLINGTFLDNKYNSLPKTGSWLSVVFPTSGTSTTESWLVVNDNQSPSSWRKVGFATNPGTYVSGVGTATYYYNVNDLLSKPTVVPNRTYIQNATCVTTFNGWVVYGINAGINNVRHSRIGDPLILKSANDREGTKSNGADFTLSESYSDVPIAMAGILDTLVIWGQEGVYAQSGPYPTAMTSIKKIPNLPGIAGKFAFCKYVDPQLGNGVIYVSRTADRAFFLYVDASSLNVQYKNVELTESIRGTFKTYLTQTLTDISKIKVAYRQDIDEIMIANGREAWVWAQPDIITGRRPITKRTLADAAMRFNFLSFPINASGTCLPIIASSGIGTTQCLMKFDPANYRDHLTTINNTYQTGKLFSTNSSRVLDVWVDKINTSCTVGVAVTSDRQADYKTIPFNLNTCHINFKTQGYQHQIGLSQTNSALTGLNNFWLIVSSNLAEQPNTRNI